MAYKIFVDTNVYLDFLLHRGNEWEKAEAILELAERNAIELFTSSSCMLNLMYIMGNYKETRQNIIAYTSTLLRYSILANPDNTTFQTALASGFTDLEDAVQYYTAIRIKGLDYFITSNLKDFKKASIQLPVLSPGQFMALYK